MQPHRLSMLRSAVPVFFLLVLFLVTYVESLSCYQCATTAKHHECKDDYGGFVNTSMGLTHKYDKNCTAANVNWTRCMILTAQGQAGVETVFHRGCHDGETFSILHDSPKFRGLPPNNQTTCGRIASSRELVCFTFCATDFCNGPQPPPPIPDPCSNTSASYAGDARCGATGLQGTVTLTSMLVCAGILLFALLL
ncbi:hypothetical protein ElyMa_003665600 [Elysia marginata]|uniref:Protein quiver n=1 Tax=Elysia marginata TaxID=1093978 RepID=A0AAV4EXR6_9GAST|nr:hypothetical protein ElyMa_003665600 [Elysia marginata]